MATYIGEMQKLVIGDKEYSLPSSGGSGTVTSVRVQATAPVQSSTSTEQTTSLNTTISLADGYGDTKNPYGTKTANYVLAGPASGSAAAPTFRTLVAADIPSLTVSKISDFPSTMTPSSHSHGNVTNGGDITATAPTIASGDQIIINDASASKITNGPTFDGSTTSKYLSQKGTWESIPSLSTYAPLASPAFTGTPTAPTPTSGAGDTQIATVKYVADAMAGAGAGTVTSVGLTNATNGGLTISGSPITGSGSITVGHSNVLTSAQTTQAVYPIKIDKNGHISAYGSAVTIPDAVTESTVSGWGFTKNTGTVTSVGLSSSRGLSISGSPVTGSGSITINNTGVLTVEASPSAASNGTIAVTTGTASGSSTAYVAVKGLAAAAYKGVTDNSSATAVTSSDTNLITGRTLYYAGYTKNFGTVTSVGISNATNGGLSVSGSPVTSSGTITVGLASEYGDTKNPYGSKTANYVLAAPNGSAGVPSFRALVAADIPDLSGTYVPVTQTGDASGNSLLPSTTTITIDPNNTGSVIQCTSTQDTELSQLNMGPWGASLQAGTPGEMGLNATGYISVGTNYNLIDLGGYNDTNGYDQIYCQGGEVGLQSFNTDYTSGTQTIITPSAFNIIHATDSGNSSLFNIDATSGAFSVPLYVNNNLVCNDMDISYNGNTYAPIMVYFPTGVSQTLAAGHVSHTTTFTMPAPYIHVIGVRAIDTNHQSVLQLTTFNINGDGASGNTVSCVAHYYNRGSSSVATTVTWELVLSTW